MVALRGLTRGLAAGLIGTAAMTAWQELSAKLQSSDVDGGADSDRGVNNDGAGARGASNVQAGAAAASNDGAEASGEQDSWAKAPAPAQVARKILEGPLHQQVPAERIGLLTNIMHWSYGTGWGAVYGLVQANAPDKVVSRGVLFGLGVWAMSYVTLVPMGIYQPPWEYPVDQLARDVSYHLAYGLGVGAGYAALPA